MANPFTAIQALPQLSFQGLEPAPYDTAGFSFSHRQARNPFPYVNGATHNWTGLDPIQLPTKLYFINGVDDRVDWFPDLWEQWRDALFNGEPGRLTSPLLGDIDAVVVSGSVSLTARHTAGVIVDVTFEQTLKDPETELVFDPLSLNLEAIAALVIEEVETAGIEAPSQESVTTLLDGAKVVSGFVSQVDNQISGTINAAKGLAAEFIGAVQLANNPSLQVTEDLLVELWSQFDQAAKAIAKNARNTGTFVVKGDSSISAIAREVGNEPQEIMTLNPDLLALPTVPRNTTVRFYTS